MHEPGPGSDTGHDIAPTAWLFRVETAPTAGAGHLSRCLNLAKALRAWRPVAVWPTDGLQGWAARIVAAGLDIVEGSSPGSGPWRGTILDGYRFDTEDIEDLAGIGSPLIAIDDFAAPPSAAHLVLNSAIGMGGDCLAGHPALLGPAFALLDERFAAPPPPVTSRINHVVISFGSADADNVAGAMVDLVLGTKVGRHAQVTVVVGQRAPNRAALESQAARAAVRGDHLSVAVNVEDMAAFYRVADLAIGAGGVGLLERMAAGLPSITVTIAANQRPGTRSAAAAGAVIDAGPADQVDSAVLRRLVDDLAADAERRRRLATCGRALVDGKGSARAAAATERFAGRWHNKP